MRKTFFRPLRVLRIAFGALVAVSIIACGGSSSSPTAGIAAPPGPTTNPQPGLAAGDISFVVPPTTSVQLIQSTVAGRSTYRLPRQTLPWWKTASSPFHRLRLLRTRPITASNGSTFTITQHERRQPGSSLTSISPRCPARIPSGSSRRTTRLSRTCSPKDKQSWVLSAGEPGEQQRALTLAGVAATGYIVCPTFAEIADPSGTCSDFANVQQWEVQARSGRRRR